MEILNRHNWFPFCTVIIGLPGETDADVKETLDLLHALKYSRMCLVPTLFVPLEDTRLSRREAAKLPRLSNLQWEVFFTCWRYSLDFFRPGRINTFRLAIPLYYYLRGRRLFGKTLKYPIFRLGHLPEAFLSRKLYLDLRLEPRRRAPESVPIPGDWPGGMDQNLISLS